MRRAFLDTAADILASEGEAGLTMKRVASTTECSVGAIYRYFPSKGALVAATHHDQLERLRRSATAGTGRLDLVLGATRRSPAVILITRVAAAAWFWVDATQTLPRELHLLQVLLASPDRHGGAAAIGTEATARVASPLVTALGRAAAGGALHDGDHAWRAAVTITTLTSVTAPTSPGRLGGVAGPAGEHSGLGLPELAGQVLSCLLVAWGADRRSVATSADLIAATRAVSGGFAPVQE